ncbi:MAG: 50S ribosomal protein L5 [Phycisphaerales bacterium]|nr:50S ribosomal protein L5 [Phycisphaerales bacterium]
MAKSKKHQEAEAPVDTGPKQPPRLKVRFDSEVSKAVGEKFGLQNPMARPRVEKIVININMGRHLEGTKIPPAVKDTVLQTISKISGQKPIVLKAKKSVSNFKVREGVDTAAMVTLRRERMWHFLDRLINLSIPRIKDFRGLPTNSFDKQGNYSMGLSEQGVFPEINMAEVNFTHGMNITICMQRSDPAKSRFLLEQLGMPFKRPETRN